MVTGADIPKPEFSFQIKLIALPKAKGIYFSDGALQLILFLET